MTTAQKSYHASTYRPNATPGKSSARGELSDLARRHFQGVKTVRLLTLPGAWWHFEKIALRNWSRDKIRLAIHACEINPAIFHIAATRMPQVDRRGLLLKRCKEVSDCHVVSNRRNAILLNCDIHRFIAATDKKFHMVWLDLMSQTTDTLVRTARRLNDIIEPHSAIAVNVLQGRESNSVTMAMGKRNRVQYWSDLIAESCPGMTLSHRWLYTDSHAAMRLQLFFTRLAPL